MKKTQGQTPEGKIDTLTVEDLNSVEVSKTSRGYSWTIKLYSADGEELPEKIEKIDKVLKEKFANNFADEIEPKPSAKE